MRRCWLVACLTALALVVAGCIGASHVTSPSSRFGAEAVAWREARYAAGHACIANLTRFLDEHVVVDDRVGGRVVQDRRTYLEACGLFAASHGTGNSDPAEPMALLVSADQILDQFHYPAHVSWTPDVDHWVTVGTVGPRGYTQVMTSASIEHWRTQVPTLQGLDRLEELADRYVALWNGGEGVDAAEVYDMRASVEDTLRGFSAQGLVELRAAVGSGRWPDLPQMEISVLTGTWPTARRRPNRHTCGPSTSAQPCPTPRSRTRWFCYCRSTTDPGAAVLSVPRWRWTRAGSRGSGATTRSNW
jgi:hypothetical protein